MVSWLLRLIPKGAKKMDINQQILQLIKKKASISFAQICRTINDRGVSYCSKKRCYANPRKRAKWGIRKNACKHQLGGITRRIRKLEEKGQIKTRREKKTDTRQNRGWDFMNACYLPEDFPEIINPIPIEEFCEKPAKEGAIT